MYGREYGGKELNFEPSGGLLHASLVMQDKETDTYWSIMTGTALAGDLAQTELVELPIGVKAQWKDWVKDYPETMVLSIKGVEHEANNPYDNYFESDEGFRGAAARDNRLPTKEAVYAFQIEGAAYAMRFSSFENGKIFKVGDREIFLFRPSGVEIFYSTLAFVSGDSEFEHYDGVWRHRSGAKFDPEAGSFGGVKRLDGFDTFWFNWSMTHPETKILE